MTINGKGQFLPKLKSDLPMPTDNNVFNYHFVKKECLSKVSLIILRCSLLKICDQAEEAWLDLGLVARPIRWPDLILIFDAI